jgi:hypothetical protein
MEGVYLTRYINDDSINLKSDISYKKITKIVIYSIILTIPQNNYMQSYLQNNYMQYIVVIA